MNYDKLQAMATKRAHKAVRNGKVTIAGHVWTLAFTPQWDYLCTSDSGETLRFITKSIKQAKYWLREYMAN